MESIMLVVMGTQIAGGACPRYRWLTNLRMKLLCCRAIARWRGRRGPRGRDVAGFTQPFRPADEERVRAFLLGYPGVTAIRELLFTFVGPGRVWIVARVDIDYGMRGAQVEALVRGIESGMKRESEDIYRVDVVPISGAQAVNT